MTTKRCSISIEPELADRFDKYLNEMGYENRSEAIRELIKQALAKNEMSDPDANVIGTLSIIFDHGKHLNHKLVHEQHKYIEHILGVSEYHLSTERSIQIITIKATAARAVEISTRIVGIRGVEFGDLTLLPDC